MRTAIMQPYFCAYLGYYQLFHAVDKIVIYDNVEFSRRGWVHRNRILGSQKAEYFTISLQQESDFLQIQEKTLAKNRDRNSRKLLNKLSNNYRNAPHFKSVYAFLRKLLEFESDNLFEFVFNSIQGFVELLSIDCEIIRSSALPIDPSLKGQNRVLAICQNLGTDTYVNLPGGRNLYQHQSFENHGIELKFIQPKSIVYDQFNSDFIPNLSIIDTLMFNSIDRTKLFLNDYDLTD